MTQFPQLRRRCAAQRHVLSPAAAVGTASFEPLEERWLFSTIQVDDDRVQCPTADFTSIEAAVLVAAPGDTIQVCPGQYDELVTVNKQLTLLGAQAGVDARSGRGSPANESIVRGLPPRPANTPGGTTAFYVTADDVVIDGFTVQDCTNPNQFGYGILLGGNTSGSHVLNNIVQNNTIGMNIANKSSTNPTIVRRNLFRNNNQPGPASGHAIYTDEFVALGAVTNVTIDSNRFTQHRSVAINLAASVPGLQSDIRITRNQSINDSTFARLGNSTGVSVQLNSVTDTVLADNPTQGNAISLVGGNSHTRVDANLIVGGGSPGGTRAGVGVTIQPGFLPNTDTDITFNYVNGRDDGIRVTGLTQGTVPVATQSDVYVYRNLCTDNTRDGIRFGADTGMNSIISNVMRDNDEHDCHDDSIGTGTAGTANLWQDNDGRSENRRGLCRSGGGGNGGDDGHGHGND